MGLEKDVSETDRFGRLLRYVWVEERMVNAASRRRGRTHWPPRTRPTSGNADSFAVDSRREAREANGRGLWGAACAQPPHRRCRGVIAEVFARESCTLGIMR